MRAHTHTTIRIIINVLISTTMDTKLDARQGQFPASFPDTFKNYFTMMNEDEDHMELFSNLLEDKVIPRVNTNQFQQRRYGGSLRCSTNPRNRHNLSCSHVGDKGPGEADIHGSAVHHVGRSNSFRFNRPRNNAISSSNNLLNNFATPERTTSVCGAGGGTASVSAAGGGLLNSVKLGGSSNNLFCKHMKYCCLHQPQHQQQKQKIALQQQLPLKSSSQQQLFQQQPTTLSALQYQKLQQQQFQPQNTYHYDYSSSSTRLGPDGEDNAGSSAMSNITNYLVNGQKQLPHHPQSQQQQQQHQQQQQQQHQQQQQQQQQQQSVSSATSQQIIKQPPQKRHSIILERAFDFDASCDESDTISSTSSTPPTTNIPYTVLKPILKQPHQNSTQQQHQHQHQHQQHRSLPQPPKNAGIGAFHTKETALQRVQQQSGLIRVNSKSNLSSLCGTAAASIISAITTTNATVATTTTTTNVTTSGTTNHYQLCGMENRSISVFNMSSTGSVVGATTLMMTTGINNNNNNSALGNNCNNSSTSANKMGVNKQTAYSEDEQFIDYPESSGTAGGGAGVAYNFNQKTNENRNNIINLRQQKSPVLNRRRSSSIATALLSTDYSYSHGNATTAGNSADATNQETNTTLTQTNTYTNARDRINVVKSPINSKPKRMNLIPVDSGGVLTFQQAMSGAVSPQYSATSPLYNDGCIPSKTQAHKFNAYISHSKGNASGEDNDTAKELDVLLEDSASNVLNSTATFTPCCPPNGPLVADTPTRDDVHDRTGENVVDMDSPSSIPQERGAGVGSSSALANVANSATNGQITNKQRQRLRTSSMPAESRKPRLADTRRAAIHCADLDLEYYRLRSFSITSHGVCNLGDSLRSRRSRSINSVTSTGTSNSGLDRHNSNASRTSGDVLIEEACVHKAQIPVYKIAMLGTSSVGKTTLTYQFTTSEYICAYDLSLDDDYGQKTVSVLVDGIETDLEIIDHPACEMSTEAFCSTYNIDLFVVVYSVVDRSSFKAAEKILYYLKENEMLLTRGAILVGNKTDLERHREVNRQMARKLAKDIACKFIETSSGLNHNVDELLVGIIAQVKLNPQRIRNLSEKDRQRLNLQNTIQKHRRLYAPQRRMVRQVSMCQTDVDDNNDEREDENARSIETECIDDQSANIMVPGMMADEGIGTGSERTASTTLSSTTAGGKSSLSSISAKGPIRKTTKRPLNLESILKMGESELEDEEDTQQLTSNRNASGGGKHYLTNVKPSSKFEMLTAGLKVSGSSRTPFSSVNSSPKARRPHEKAASTNILLRVVDGADSHQQYNESPPTSRSSAQIEASGLITDCNRKTVSKLTSRTKIFLSSVLRFKRAINVTKRRNSSSCSDLFVI
ncbi:serine-rich adhesin for platelets [Glossina fuscipes]|uniref:Serine-rich adhesin for platelets n=1 Tax=Glossina fuscipes TaxID=7396 RepID=A0A9C5Z3V9_9MUSC|nr:serine-rich adhesin for platelets [Glossina fuscipes]